MRKRDLKIIVKIALIITLYYFSYYIYKGIESPVPALGDSWDYHIPISKTILDGRFIAPENFKLPQWYYPGSSEAINSILMFFRIPLTLSNILAVSVLFFSLYKLALTFRLKKLYSLLFAITFISLNVVIRWMNAVSIDVWMAVFYVWAIILLESPKRKLTYFGKLGFMTGMIIGSKYTGIAHLLVLLVFYWRRVITLLTMKRVVAFLVPFSVFGLFWYVRNYIYVGNPFFPLPILNFPGTEIYGGKRVLDLILLEPVVMFNSIFAEYKTWIIVIPIAILSIVNKFVVKKEYNLDATHKLYLLGFFDLLVYLSFPTGVKPWIMVSSLRYSYPALIPLMLGVFIQAARHKKEVMVGYFAIGNMILVLSMAYHPKLTLIYIPLALIVFRYIDRLEDRNES